MKRFWKDYLLALSAVNLLFFRRWSVVLPGYGDYLLAEARSGVTYVSLIVIILGLAALAVGAVALVRQTGDRRLLVGTRILFVTVSVMGVFSVFYEGWLFLGLPFVDHWPRIFALAVALVLVAWLVWGHTGWHRQIVPVTVAVMFILMPLAPIMITQGIYHAATPDDRFDVRLDGNPPGRNSDHRVLWLLFDELDQRLAFEERPDDVHLPEFDRLRDEGFYATQAYAPNEFTARSMPAMLSGMPVGLAYGRGHDDLGVEFLGEDEPVDWKTMESLFDRLHERGLSIDVVGTYHPYCRLFPETLTDCTFVPHHGPPATDFLTATQEHLENLKLALPTYALQESIWTSTGLNEAESVRQQHRDIAKHQALEPPAVHTAARPDIDYAFIHLNTPHPAGEMGHGRGYWDAENRRFSAGGDESFFDNLMLADRTLGRIRTAMEENGTWNQTTVIVSSDHGYRATWWQEQGRSEAHTELLRAPTDHRVAYLAKPGGPGSATEAVQYDEPFNLVLMADLIEAAFQDGFRTPDDFARWLDVNREQGASDHYALH